MMWNVQERLIAKSCINSVALNSQDPVGPVHLREPTPIKSTRIMPSVKLQQISPPINKQKEQEQKMEVTEAYQKYILASLENNLRLSLQKPWEMSEHKENRINTTTTNKEKNGLKTQSTCEIKALPIQIDDLHGIQFPISSIPSLPIVSIPKTSLLPISTESKSSLKSPSTSSTLGSTNPTLVTPPTISHELNEVIIVPITSVTNNEHKSTSAIASVSFSSSSDISSQQINKEIKNQNPDSKKYDVSTAVDFIKLNEVLQKLTVELADQRAHISSLTDLLKSTQISTRLSDSNDLNTTEESLCLPTDFVRGFVGAQQPEESQQSQQNQLQQQNDCILVDEFVLV